MPFLTYYSLINKWMFIVSKCPFSIDKKSKRVHTSKMRITIFLTLILAYELFLILFGNVDMHIFSVCDSELCAVCSYLVSFSMVHSHVILSIQSLSMRTNQMHLLEQIGEFDKYFMVKVSYYVNVNHLKDRAISTYLLFVFYNILILFIFITLDAKANLNGIAFFIGYILSDLCFTATVFNICFYGYFLNNRYAAIHRHLEKIAQYTNPCIRKHISEITILYYRLFDLQMNFVKVFGMLLLYTIIYHSAVIAVAVYMFIISMKLNPYKTLVYLFQLVGCMLPYFIRIGLLINVFAPIGEQVNKCDFFQFYYFSMVFRYFFCCRLIKFGKLSLN